MTPQNRREYSRREDLQQLFKLDQAENRRQEMLKQSKERQRKVIESHVAGANATTNNTSGMVSTKEVSLLSSVAQKTMAAKHKKKLAQRRVPKKRVYTQAPQGEGNSFSLDSRIQVVGKEFASTADGTESNAVMINNRIPHEKTEKRSEGETIARNQMGYGTAGTLRTNKGSNNAVSFSGTRGSTGSTQGIGKVIENLLGAGKQQQK